MPLSSTHPATSTQPAAALYGAPRPLPGPAPRAQSSAAAFGDADAICRPRAQSPLAAPPGERKVVDGTPEVLLAGAALGGLALAASGLSLVDAAASAGTTLRSTGAYAASLARSVAHSLADPVKAGEHIAEGLIGGAAWAAAAASVASLADAARTRLAHDAPPEARR